MGRRPSLYVLPGNNPGLVVRGNIDINNRPDVANPAGGRSSVFSVSFDIVADGGKHYEVLVVRVIGNRIVTPRQAYLHYIKTGKHLGIFDTPAHATAYAKRLHMQQASLMKTGVR